LVLLCWRERERGNGVRVSNIVRSNIVRSNIVRSNIELKC